MGKKGFVFMHAGIETQFDGKLKELVSLVKGNEFAVRSIEEVGKVSFYKGEREYLYGEDSQKKRFADECLAVLEGYTKEIPGFREGTAKAIAGELYELGCCNSVLQRNETKKRKGVTKSVLGIGVRDVVRCRCGAVEARNWNVEDIVRNKEGNIVFSLRDGELGMKMAMNPFSALFCVQANGGNTIIDKELPLDKVRLEKALARWPGGYRKSREEMDLLQAGREGNKERGGSLSCLTHDERKIAREESERFPLILTMKYGFCEAENISKQCGCEGEGALFHVAYVDNRETPYGLYEKKTGGNGFEDHALWNFERDFTSHEAVVFLQQYREFERKQEEVKVIKPDRKKELSKHTVKR